jgi:hypothetical protein
MLNKIILSECDFTLTQSFFGFLQIQIQQHMGLNMKIKCEKNKIITVPQKQNKIVLQIKTAF